MALLWVCFFQTIAIGWVFGAERFCDCVEQMTGIRPNMFWYLCWKYFAPLVMFAVFIFYCISYSPVTYGHDYVYPGWAEILGLLMSFSSMIWVPGYAIYYVLTQPGTIMEVMKRDTVQMLRVSARYLFYVTNVSSFVQLLMRTLLNVKFWNFSRNFVNQVVREARNSILSSHECNVS